MNVTELRLVTFSFLSMCCLGTVLQYVQYAAPCVRTNHSEAPHTMLTNLIVPMPAVQ